jgi:hypothetical protein
MTDELKSFGRKRRGLIMVLSQNLPRGTEDIHDTSVRKVGVQA